MNAILVPPETAAAPIPLNHGSGRYYARFSQTERLSQTPGGLYPAIWILEAFDQEWFDTNPQPETPDGLPDYYMRARLFVLEVKVEMPGHWRLDRLAAIFDTDADDTEPDEWFVIQSVPLDGRALDEGEVPMTIYPNLYLAGIPATLVEAGPAAPETSARLRRVVSTAHIRDATEQEVDTALAGVAGASVEWVVAYDVGQGNSIGLCEPAGSVKAYFDLGGGVKICTGKGRNHSGLALSCRNRRTAAATRCFSRATRATTTCASTKRANHMKKSLLETNGIPACAAELVGRLVNRIEWPERRVAMAEVTLAFLDGKARLAEKVFGWGRAAVELGLQELRSGIVCVNDLSRRRKPRSEEKYPKLLALADIRLVMDLGSHAQSHLRTPLAYPSTTARSVRSALLEKGWLEAELPGVRTISNILNRQDYRLRRVEKSRVQKKRRGPTPSSGM